MSVLNKVKQYKYQLLLFCCVFDMPLLISNKNECSNKSKTKASSENNYHGNNIIICMGFLLYCLTQTGIGIIISCSVIESTVSNFMKENIPVTNLQYMNMMK